MCFFTLTEGFRSTNCENVGPAWLNKGDNFVRLSYLHKYPRLIFFCLVHFCFVLSI